MSIIDKNIRETKNIDCEHIDILWLSIFKSYLKILSLLYIVNNTNCSITSDIIEGVLKETHIFNNVVLTSKPHIIKALNNSDSVSEMKTVNLVFIYVPFILIFFILFLESRIRIKVTTGHTITYISHIRWLGHINGHKVTKHDRRV